ncbi:hypothetical protein [Tuwongella immobilis]|uniref:Uncharacterized protein n=1 Tax=Tuwongella immobilis TaxID=692036 RepID=A0A6C2YSR9_9BACT|nr:hypothetical protein [Tuwongella immobilis]VIP04760.1 unnamed protein product [Tuwongella immobilis]VTS06879.1 unnamed protein product [Tuwongella immobilis]
MQTRRSVPALLMSFLAGAVVGVGLFVSLSRRSPPTPVLRPPIAMQVTLYPWEGSSDIDGQPVDIPKDKLDRAFLLLTPDTDIESGIHDLAIPVVAKAVLAHADGTETPVLVRDHGHNPAVVTVDGRHYFFARSEPDVDAGAIELIRIVNQVRDNNKATD